MAGQTGKKTKAKASTTASTERTSATAAVPDRLRVELRHADGCPEDPDRVESYTSTRPADPARSRPAKLVRVFRCQDCSAQLVTDEEGDA